MAISWPWKWQSSAPSTGPRFPRKQLAILALVRLCEPIAFMSIFPYIYYMIDSFNITQDSRQIAIFAGLVTSAFAFAEFSTGILWGKLSDRIGRKPVLIGGLVGTAISMILFGFSRSLPSALLARFLGGFLNGNIGVLQTTVAELVTVKEHQPRAYSIMPFIWCLGSIIGPSLGGALAQPHESWPTLFPSGSLFARYPFLLPNLVCFLILCCGIVLGTLFLEETHAERKRRPDFGLVLGQWLVKRLGHNSERAIVLDKDAEDDLETFGLLEGDETPPPEYRTTENTPRHSSSEETSPGCVEKQIPSKPQRTFTRQIVLLIVNYGILAFHTISFDQLMPVYLSSPVSKDKPVLPFKFTGGFELSTRTIGVMLSLAGIYAMVAQLVVFPMIIRRFGALRPFQCTLLTWPLLYMVVPYLSLLPQWMQVPAAFLCMIWRTTNQTLSFPSFSIIINNSAPSRSVLGLINGVAASSASLSRAFGPTLSGILHAWALKIGVSGLSWWISGAICLIGAIESLWLEEGAAAVYVDEKRTPCRAQSESCDTVAGDVDLSPGAVSKP